MTDGTTDFDVLRRLRAVGRAIRAARGALTQEELGVLLGVPQTTVSRWERGTMVFDVEQLRALEMALGLKPGLLFDAGGYLGGVGPSQGEPIRTLELVDTDAVVGVLRAAGEFDFGVKVTNCWQPAALPDTAEVTWQVLVWAEAPGAEDF